ncbi:DNA-binding FadR family transcriptional regulator [Desulfobotulus alkaliphilus]|uniref:DNA-binding FadR family transcriptional regulator n=1 Tax=Desulfobotulus alkaliphilus TaxID=622671 RepID=A0A562REV4_9BACT|nr:GntR family transcriptional regulator [Desulfobotulus alkaliphilus]TWI66946.1 DNA-binding FadR family transcriptional regulator [Desulfobotulus alkaliphilus]
MATKRSDTVFKALQREILTGVYPENTRLPSERLLGEMHGVSRITIRDAIARLAQLGLVEKQPQSGIYVRPFRSEASLDLLIHMMQTEDSMDSDTLVSLLEFRRLAAVFIVRKAALHPDSHSLDKLKALLQDAEQHLLQEENPLTDNSPENIQALADADFAFHAGIVAMTRNMVAQLLFNSFKPAYRYYSLFFYGLEGAAKKALQNHKEILAALCAGDENYAAWKMEETLSYAENRVKEALGILEESRTIRLREEGESLRAER